MNFRTNYSKLKGSRQIITVLTKHGMDYFIDRPKAMFLTRIKRIPKSYQALSLPKRICMSLEKLGLTSKTLIKLKSIFEHKGLEKLTREISCSKRRMFISIIIASIIAGSSLIMQMHIGLIIFGYPIQGIIGYIVAIF
jgi:ubiquinone biosynthesis protein